MWERIAEAPGLAWGSDVWDLRAEPGLVLQEGRRGRGQKAAWAPGPGELRTAWLEACAKCGRDTGHGRLAAATAPVLEVLPVPRVPDCHSWFVVERVSARGGGWWGVWVGWGFCDFVLWRIWDIDKGRNNSKTVMFSLRSFSCDWFMPDLILYTCTPTHFSPSLFWSKF